jgi:hypothetical protein
MAINGQDLQISILDPQTGEWSPIGVAVVSDPIPGYPDCVSVGFHVQQRDPILEDIEALANFWHEFVGPMRPPVIWFCDSEAPDGSNLP